MASLRSASVGLPVFFFALMLFHAFATSSVQAQVEGPAPPPSSDGTTLDLGIAYVLMFAALAVTYLVHPIDSLPFKLF
ncbi:hypothetical protein GOP47_0004362 [Adiantum capillus-veneris]|uniref:Uncharacterized protein n=1 Tax=Adiantum capillus-veneris TaxID=13818 RepID=A0A9D4V7E7_ADICA|nr:hypothetical protein GOP47_0004362 [Adiantum capillus-veneris]